MSYIPLDKPLATDVRARALYVLSMDRAIVLDGLTMSTEELIECNRKMTEEAAGSGWRYINLGKDSLLPISKMTQRLAQENNQFILKNIQYKEKAVWM